MEWNGADEDDYKRMDIIEPMITDEFVNTGTVLMYLQIRFGDTHAVYALPFTTSSGQMFVFFIRPEGLSESFVPGTLPEEAGLSFYIQRSTGVDSGGFIAIRYVLIPDGLPAKMPDLFWRDYKSVADFFEIPD